MLIRIHFCIKNKNISRLYLKGFTLIELLIAVSIFGIISVSIVSVFSRGLDIYNRVKEYGNQQVNAVLFFEHIERDIRSIFYFSSIGFSGSNNSLSFPGLVRMGTGEKSKVSVGRIYYYFDKHTGYLVKAEQTYPLAVSKEGNTITNRRRLFHVKQMLFKYLYINSEGEYEWKDKWVSKDGIPKAVMVRIEFNSAGRDYVWSKVILIPVAI